MSVEGQPYLPYLVSGWEEMEALHFLHLNSKRKEDNWKRELLYILYQTNPSNIRRIWKKNTSIFPLLSSPSLPFLAKMYSNTHILARLTLSQLLGLGANYHGFCKQTINAYNHNQSLSNCTEKVQESKLKMKKKNKPFWKVGKSWGLITIKTKSLGQRQVSWIEDCMLQKITHKNFSMILLKNTQGVLVRTLHSNSSFMSVNLLYKMLSHWCWTRLWVFIFQEPCLLIMKHEQIIVCSSKHLTQR